MAIFALDWPGAGPEECQGGVLTIGNFDGVHLGHASLVRAARDLAGQLGGPAIAVTFDPHPLQLLRPEKFRPVLTLPEDRARLLLDLGADHVLIVRTTRELLGLEAIDFFEQFIRDRLQARGAVEGQDFCFGRNRSGDVELLERLCAGSGLRLVVVPPLLHQGNPVSSSRVRNHLGEGQVAEAATLLGRPYRLRGTVGTGQKRGRTLGFPTANLTDVQTVIPADGVYAVRSSVDGVEYAGAANIGPNPTFGEGARKLEVHLIGYQGDLYGRALEVDFLAHLRATRPFGGIEELRTQLGQDIAQAVAVSAEFKLVEQADYPPP